ncbi:MAG: hypothetical protein HYY32_03570, partial [Chloroflexi bacterium]|nr:hypothetical protein [Chloroflexota bacterium]
RLDTLSGKTIGELWNLVFRGDKIFPILEEELSRRFPGVKFERYETFGPTHGPDEAKAINELPGKLKKYSCDAVISGVGC